MIARPWLRVNAMHWERTGAIPAGINYEMKCDVCLLNRMRDTKKKLTTRGGERKTKKRKSDSLNEFPQG